MNDNEGTTPVEPEKSPEEGYHLVEDMTDKAAAWIAQQKFLAPDKPFFVYFAPGTTQMSCFFNGKAGP
jgi:arylsulfatase A-like enzyme